MRTLQLLLALLFSVNIYSQEPDWAKLMRDAEMEMQNINNPYNQKVLNRTSTTEQEYTYVTKGIKSSISNALDIKNGYTINGNKDFSALETPTYSFDNRQWTFATLEREKDKSVAAIIVKYNSSSYEYWYCIPIANEGLLNSFQKSFRYDAGETMAESFVTALLYYFMDAFLLEKSIDNKIQTSIGAALLKNFNLTDAEIKEIKEYRK